MHIRRSVAVLLTAALSSGALAAVAPGAGAVQAEHPAVVSTTPSAATPGLKDGTVHDIVQIGGTVVAGGSFSAVTSNAGVPAPADEIAQARIMAFDAGTGTVSRSFAPRLDGTVNVVRAGADGTVYVGGDFKYLDGVRVDGLVRLRLSDGRPVPGFAVPLRKGNVNTLEVVGDRLFVGGTFTTTLGSRARVGLATLDAATGALDPYLDSTVAVNHNWTPASDPAWAKAQVGVVDLDVTPDGTKMVAIGNFKQVDGVTTGVDQVAVWDLGAAGASLSPWRTLRFGDACGYQNYDSWVRDVDFSPKGDYFVVVAVGGYLATGLCDTASRWQTPVGVPKGLAEPVWAAYSGGDSLMSVAVTGSAVYVGGHQRWMNNPAGRNVAGGGAVPRPGVAALDPLTGLPLAWNPGRHPRGVGTAALYATEHGLWMGSDTETIGAGSTRQTRRRLAFFPLVSRQPRDTSVPRTPGGLYLGPPAPPTSNAAVLHRINAGGPALLSMDSGPEWSADTGTTSPYRADSSSVVLPTVAYDKPVPRLHSSVPAASTPLALFADDRQDLGRKGDGREMLWRLPVSKGRSVSVRLFFAARHPAYWPAGKGVFDVRIDGVVKADNLDISSSVGPDTALMKAYTVTSDGSVDVDLTHEVGHPIIAGIEVVASGVTGPALPYGQLSARTFNGSTAGATPVSTPSTVDANGVRGAVMIGKQLFYGKNNGRLYRRDVSGRTWSGSTHVNPYDDPVWSTIGSGSPKVGTEVPYRGMRSTFSDDISNITSMSYDPATSRLYYTMYKQPYLYYRPFSPDSGVIHPTRSVAPGSGIPLDLVSAFVDRGSLYYARSGTNTLYKVPFAWSAALPAPTATIPAPSGVDWRSRALFLGPEPFENRAPTARASATCSGLRCTADASASTDPDGPISSYRWTWGDGSTTTTPGPTATHDYATPGTRTVTLQVTDAEGLAGSTTFAVAPSA